MDRLVKLIPLFIALSFVLYIVLRMNWSMRLQKEAVARQKEAMNQVDRSIKLQTEALQTAKEQNESVKGMLSEIQDIKRFIAEAKKTLDSKQ